MAERAERVETAETVETAERAERVETVETVERAERAESGRAGRDGREGRDGRAGREGREGRDGRAGRDGRDGREGRACREGREGRDVFSGPRGTWIGMVNECHVAARHPPGGCGIRNWTPLTLFSFVYSNTWSTCDVFETKTSISMDAFASSRPSQPTMALRLVVSSCSLRSGPNWPRMPYLRQ